MTAEESSLKANLVSEKEALSGNTHIVRLSGELDIHSAPQFKEDVLSLIEQGYTNIVLDLDELNFMDSRGLGTFISISRNVKDRGGSLKIICSNQTIMKIFQRTGLCEIFAMYESKEAALH
ncbi:MAG: STAS domain-containing protein [Candidatus Xenobiia bacterium LiM19]